MLVIESLRQLYFSHGPTWGLPLSSILYDVRAMIRAEDRSIVVGREGVEYDNMLAIVNELVASNIAAYHVTKKTKRTGTWPFHTDTVETERFYKLTTQGVDFAREMTDTPRLQVNVAGNIHLNSADRVIVHGDAYILHVEQLIREDHEFKLLMERVCATNARSITALENAVYSLLSENASLRKRVESRGWSLLHLAVSAAKLAARLMGLHIS